MVLSDGDLRKRVIQEPQEANEAKLWWEKGQWDKIGNRILIDPFKTTFLGNCTYDLSVGEEYRSLRDPRNSKPLKEREKICIGPGESVLILTEEYISLPKNVVGIIVPRARWIFEGTSICATRIDPTWYGKLVIGFTNHAKNPVELYRQEAFCTAYFMETRDVEVALSKERVLFLGRTSIGKIDFSHALEQKLLATEKVDREDIEKVVDLYGWPWDVVRGMFVLTLKEVIDYVEKEVAPTIVQDATAAAIEKAYENQQKWFKILVTGLLSIFGALLVVAGYIIIRLVN